MVQTLANAAVLIRQNVLDQLQWNSGVDASDIRVNVEGRKVILTGSVPTYRDRQNAEADALIIPGVGAVENRLEVKHPAGVTIPSDAELQGNIKSALHWNPNIDSTRVNVAVTAGLVRLEGSVPSYLEKARAHEVTAGIRGVIAIQDRLAVVPTETVGDGAIAAAIISAFKRNLNANQGMITVEVDHGAVVLTGVAPDLVTRRDAENIARYTRGVINVKNNLVVGR